MESVAFLLQAGADPNPEGQGGRTPLMQAAEAGEVDIVRLLLISGADSALADAQGRTALDRAAHRPKIIALLSAAQGAADDGGDKQHEDEEEEEIIGELVESN